MFIGASGNRKSLDSGPGRSGSCRCESDHRSSAVEIPKLLGDLGHGQVAGDVPRMRLAALDEEAMAQANDADGAGQDGGTFGRAIPLPRQRAAISSSVFPC